MAHAFNLSTREADVGESLSSRPAWPADQALGQLGKQRKGILRKHILLSLSKRLIT